MKPLITALGICALLLAAGAAYAQVDYTWDGAQNSNWKQLRTSNNWVQDADGYPGLNQAGDTATIADDTNANPTTPCYLAGSVANDVADVTLDALTAAGALELEIRTGATLNINDAVTGTLQLIGGDAATEEATFNYQAGTLSIDNIDMDGGTADTMEAILELEAALTLDDTTDSLLVTGYARIDTTATFTAKDVKVGDGALTTFCEKKTGTGELDATGLTITAGNEADEPATFKLSAGTLDVNGTIKVDSGTASGTHAKLWSTVTTLEFTDMTLDGYDSNAKAILDLDQTVSQSSSDVTAKQVAEMQLTSTFTIDDLFIGSESGDYDGALTVSGGGTLDANRIVIEGDTGGNGSSLTVSSSTVVTS